MEKKDPVINEFWQKVKHPTVVAFLVMLFVLVIFAVVVDFIRPEYVSLGAV